MSERGAFDASLWRAFGVFRTLALCYMVLRFVEGYRDFTHRPLAIGVVCVVALWTGYSVVVYRRPSGRRVPVLCLDVAVAAVAVLASRIVESPQAIAAGAITLPTVWSSTPVAGWAIAAGWPGGTITTVVLGCCDLLERGAVTEQGLHNDVLMLLLGVSTGYVAEIARRAERAMARGLRLQAVARERQRLARDIHDGVLQVLALVQRRGVEIGGPAADLARLAGDQERALRTLVMGWRAADAVTEADDMPEDADLAASIRRFASAWVTVAAPQKAVMLPPEVCAELVAAVSAALDNVRRHAPDARTWILVEDAGDEVVVSVRDDGPGIPTGRLEQAEREGRLGVAESIRGRVQELGGVVSICTAPGEGTDIELRVPRTASLTR